ncbi:hypothetical protein GCM10023065_31070 [Microbacterium laevaniformans]
MAERCDADEVLERLPRRTAADELVERRGIVRSPIAAQSSGEQFTPRKGEHMGGEQLGIDVGRGDARGGEGRRRGAQQRGQVGRRAGDRRRGHQLLHPSRERSDRRGSPAPTVKFRHIRLGNTGDA